VDRGMLNQQLCSIVKMLMMMTLRWSSSTFFLEDDANGFIYDMYQYAMHIDKHLTRAKYRQPGMSSF
jgi:hypothetical protein